jgi:hypothetical protein
VAKGTAGADSRIRGPHSRLQASGVRKEKRKGEPGKGRSGRGFEKNGDPPLIPHSRLQARGGTEVPVGERREQSAENKKKKEKKDEPKKKEKKEIRKRSSSVGCGTARPRTRCEATSCRVTSQTQAEKGVCPRASREQAKERGTSKEREKGHVLERRRVQDQARQGVGCVRE